MALALWSRFYPEVAPYVIGCPNQVIDNALRNAAIDLFDFGRVHTVYITLDTVANQSIYALNYSSDTTVSDIIEAYSDARRLTPKVTDVLGENGEVWEVKTGTLLNYYQDSPDSVRIFPTPDAVFSITFRVALKPTRTATGVESEFAERYLDEICDGALSRLLAIPQKSWTDKQTAMEKRMDFEKAKGDARIDAMRNFTIASVQVQPRAFR